jgi:ABC-type transport system involved in cytochrome bd biosynthesis fused ATPase/permease subunit
VTLAVIVLVYSAIISIIIIITIGDRWVYIFGFFLLVVTLLLCLLGCEDVAYEATRQQAAGSRQQAAGSRQQAAGSRQQAAHSTQHTADSTQQTADSTQQTLRQACGERQGRPPLAKAYFWSVYTVVICRSMAAGSSWCVRVFTYAIA